MFRFPGGKLTAARDHGEWADPSEARYFLLTGSDHRRIAEQTKAVADWINSSDGSIVYYPEVQVTLIGKRGVAVWRKPINLTPDNVTDYFPHELDQEALRPIRVENGALQDPVFQAQDLALYFPEKLVRCQQCGNFFYAPTPRRKFCGEACRIAFFKSDPAWKAKRRENAKRYRNTPERLKLVRARKPKPR